MFQQPCRLESLLPRTSILGHEGAPMVTLARGGVRVSISGAFCSPGGLMNRENDGVTVVSPP